MAIGLQQQYLVINGVLALEEGNTDHLARAIGHREQATLAAIPSPLQALPSDRVSLKPFNLVGLPALRSLLVDDVSPYFCANRTTIRLKSVKRGKQAFRRQAKARKNCARLPFFSLRPIKSDRLLAETTPVLEAANLQSELPRAGIEPWAWIINHSVAAVPVSSPLLQQRAMSELVQINTVATRHAGRYAIVPLLEDEPVGVDRLQTLAGGTHAL